MNLDDLYEESKDEKVPNTSVIDDSILDCSGLSNSYQQKFLKSVPPNLEDNKNVSES